MSNDVTLPGTGELVEAVDLTTSLVTSASTTAGSAVLTFASVPREIVKGMVVTDSTAPSVIPGSTKVLSYTDTTVTLTANVTGAGVGNGDTIIFTGGKRQVAAVASQGYSASASFTCGTTAYAVRDAVGASGAAAALQFAGIGPANREILITSLSLEIDRAALISGEANYALHLYSVTPPSAVNDSAAWDLVSGDRASYLGLISIPTPVDLGSTLYVELNSINKQVKLKGADLFAYLVTEAAYTPTAAVHKLTMHSVPV